MAQKRWFLFLVIVLILVVIVNLIIQVFSFKPSRLVTPRSTRTITLNPTVTNQPSPEIPSVTIGLMGDLGLGRHISSTARSKNDFGWSFDSVSDWLKRNDFNLANLESPIIPNCPEGKTGTFTFCGDERFLPKLLENKFYLNLANNHILNYGNTGLSQTEDFLKQYQIPYVYSHRAGSQFLLKNINGIKLGFLGFDLSGGHKLDKEKITKLVKQHDSDVDCLIVSLHWGAEYLPQPEQWRIDFAHILVENGADIIAGHHPHVVQPVEWYKNKPIFYSLGNFIFDQNWSWETSHSNLYKLNIRKDQVSLTETLPVEIKHNSRPEAVISNSKPGQ